MVVRPCATLLLRLLSVGSRWFMLLRRCCRLWLLAALATDACALNARGESIQLTFSASVMSLISYLWFSRHSRMPITVTLRSSCEGG